MNYMQYFSKLFFVVLLFACILIETIVYVSTWLPFIITIDFWKQICFIVYAVFSSFSCASKRGFCVCNLRFNLLHKFIK